MPQTISKTTTPKTVKTVASKVVAETKVVQPVTLTTKSFTFQDKNLKISPRKLRLLVNSVKKLSPVETVARLQFVNTNSSRLFRKVLSSAIATAKNNYQADPVTLKFEHLLVNEGQKIKRMDKSHGSHFARGVKVKRHSRLVIILSGKIPSQSQS